MRNPIPNPEDDFAVDASEERLGALINEFFDRRESGEDLTEEQFLAEHPEHAEHLREHLGGLGLLEKLGSSSARRLGPRDEAPAATTSDLTQDRPAQPAAAPPQIPGYEILKQIGRGGMGVVFKAVQTSTKRVVALKLLLEGPFASEVQRRRFEREIALAAQLRHPNIIPIYDSGSAEGRMFYAMEHIYGMPVGDYLRAHSLTIDAKLQLFVKICNALAHAHVRGVVHRDLKPSNILVDADGDPHVLDFGLAKAGALGDMTTSLTAQIIGTPAYMSPEQASGDPGGIDTRTDVYSLGVMIYEALTGRLPYDTSGPMAKILRNIADAEPPVPGKLNPQIDGELSAIILKALQKGKEDRYQSVDAMADDLRRYLAGEPVSAKPASGLYLLRKALYKYRLPVAFAAILVLCLSITLITLQVWRSSRAEVAKVRQEVRQLQEEASENKAARVEAEEQHRKAEAARREAEAAQREYEWLIKNVDPEFAKKIDPIARALGKSVGSGEDPTAAAARLAAQLLAEVEPGPQQPRPKKQDLVTDLQSPMMSSRPPAAAQGASKTDTAGLDDVRKKLLQALLKRIEGQQAASPASRPAATEPFETDAAPAEPPTTLPAAPAAG